MDPITHFFFASILAAVFVPQRNFRRLVAISASAALLPDLLPFLLEGEYNLYRNTIFHSLLSIPFIALIIALLLKYLLAKNANFFDDFTFAFIGLFSYSCLEYFASFGANYFYPFSKARFSVNLLPFFHSWLLAILIIFSILSFTFRKRIFADIGLGIFVIFILISFWQSHKVRIALKEMAIDNGFVATDKDIKIIPTFANLTMWRGIYKTSNSFVYAAFNTPIFTRDVIIHKGAQVSRVFSLKSLISLRENSLPKELKDFLNFTGEYYYIDLYNNDRLVDIRFSYIPNLRKPIWVLKLHEANNNVTVEFSYIKPNYSDVARFRNMIDVTK